jgi:L-Ala-D/L-Glu epimerase
MKIKRIRPSIKSLPLTKPYTIAYHTISDVELVFLEIELEDGTVGIGSASPAEFVVGENSRQTLSNLESTFVQDIVGRDIRHFQEILFRASQHFQHLPGTQTAIDLALHDAYCKWLGISVAAFYGQKITSLPTSVTIGIKDILQTLEEAQSYFDSGFKILKVKTGIRVEEDIEKIVKLQERFKNNVKIRVDANQGYSLSDLREFIKATRQVPVELIEQPLPVGKENDLLLLDEQDRMILAGDESIKDASAGLMFSNHPQPFHIYNIKLMKCGGIRAALEIANIAFYAGIDLFWGCNDESIISITAALHAAFACANTRYLDLDGSFDLIESTVRGGFILKDGFLSITDKPGFGIDHL